VADGEGGAALTAGAVGVGALGEVASGAPTAPLSRTKSGAPTCTTSSNFVKRLVTLPANGDTDFIRLNDQHGFVGLDKIIDS
jgi:hypothetical protein